MEIIEGRLESCVRIVVSFGSMECRPLRVQSCKWLLNEVMEEPGDTMSALFMLSPLCWTKVCCLLLVEPNAAGCLPTSLEISGR